MMKKTKLSLTELKIKSFVTEGDKNKAETIKGGIAIDPTAATYCFVCPPYPDPTKMTICLVCGTYPVKVCPQDQ
ncbi:MAG: pinensin family lanthipeptide [Cyclobacteriaceae bacterium]